MTMYREPPPGQDNEPPLVNDAPDDAQGYEQPRWNVMRIVFGLFAILVLLAALLWVGEALGLLAILAGS